MTTDWVLAGFGKQRKRSVEGYRTFIKDGKNQVYLGSDDFVEEPQCKIGEDQSLNDTPKPQKLAPLKPLAYFVSNYTRNEGMARAYLSGHYTLAQVGKIYGVSYATVSRAVKAFE